MADQHSYSETIASTLKTTECMKAHQRKPTERPRRFATLEALSQSIVSRKGLPSEQEMEEYLSCEMRRGDCASETDAVDIKKMTGLHKNRYVRIVHKDKAAVVLEGRSRGDDGKYNHVYFQRIEANKGEPGRRHWLIQTLVACDRLNDLL